ncbi:sporulation protein [Bacillus xiapuensis]|uniref:sporulation protein n=1 Tax=Bacillus xiapuensis TaxID=2014075 RepID=UPI000C239FA0|nr:sporulation protein [Bacillus xiapuensis]
MLKRFLSSIGIGGVTIDTVVTPRTCSAGDTVKGKVMISGGRAEVYIQSIVLQLVTEIEETRDDSDFAYQENEIERITLDIDRAISPDETKEIPFKLSIQEHHPATREHQRTYLRTTAVIPQAVNPTDQDELVIKK